MKSIFTIIVLLLSAQLFAQQNNQLITFEPDNFGDYNFQPVEGKPVDNSYLLAKYGVQFFVDSLNSKRIPIIAQAGYPATAIIRGNNEPGGTVYLDSVWACKDDLPSGNDRFGFYFLTDDGKIVRHPKDLILDFDNDKINCSLASGYIIDVDGPERWVVNVYSTKSSISPCKSMSACVLGEGYWSPDKCDIPARGDDGATFWEVDISPEVIDYVEFRFDEKQSYYRPVGLAFDNFSICSIGLESDKEGEILNWDSILVGQPIILKNVEFDFNKAELLESSYDELNKLCGYLNKNPDMCLEISGHTDNTGEETFNQKLSEYRAENVAKYLIDKGISTGRVKHVGWGSTKPIVENSTEENKQKNRRVEFRVVEGL